MDSCRHLSDLLLLTSPEPSRTEHDRCGKKSAVPLLKYKQVILEFEYDPEPERTLWKRRQAQRLAESSSLKTEEEPTTKAMGDEQRITMGDYCKRTDTNQISLGFQPANPANFDIKGNVLTGPAKDWLQCLPRGTIATWKELEDKFL
ncbi:hypothetical protein QL285_057296 [Trifolium repens]|nr:hypothetical protein QL285_057296 [Trifolium repens]